MAPKARGRSNEPWGWLESDGEKHEVPADVRKFALGRDPASEFPIDEETVSWNHAEIVVRNNVLLIRDCDSHNGTTLDGQAVTEHGTRLRHGAQLRLGDAAVAFREAGQEGKTARVRKAHRFRLDRQLEIGREPRNDIVLDEPNVSRFHAVIKPSDPPVIEDLGSRNGTRLRDKKVRRSDLSPGDEIGIGPFRLQYDGTNINLVDERAGMHLQADGAGVTVGGQEILQPTSLTVAPGEFLALLGPSGSGKSTLLKTLAAVIRPSTGGVRLASDPIELRLTDLGYVPQADSIHERLTVRECLTYAARLRLPSDTNRSEIADAVKATEKTLGLADHSSQKISSLSGGQRKRAACGVELIGQPTMLLLDEPTSGLDPSFERRLMGTFRQLADGGHGLVVVTHATGSLDLCDTVAAMRVGGHLDFLGTPQGAISHYEADRYEEIYDILQEPVDRSRQASPARAFAASPESERAPRKGFGRQFRTLCARYARTILRDRRTLLVLLGQVPVIALCVAALFPADLLALPDFEPGRSAQYVFLLITAAIWLGLISSCREIVKERTIVLRELTIGVRLWAYLASKTVILLLLVGLQAALLLTVALLFQPLDADSRTYFLISAVVAATSFAAVGMGLAVSTLARNVDQATSFVPLLLIPQLLFAGAIVPWEAMQSTVQTLSNAIFARWSFAGAGSAIDLNSRLEEEPGQAAVYGDQFFDVSPELVVAILVGFFLAGLVTAATLLSKRTTTID